MIARRRLWAFGNECGSDHLVFISRYEDEPDYIEGFVEGCLERIAEEEDEDLTHPDDVTAEQIRNMWLDPGMSPEEKREMVLEPLKAECEVREDSAVRSLGSRQFYLLSTDLGQQGTEGPLRSFSILRLVSRR